MARKRINSPLTSSCGRFFDAISSLLGLRQKIAYEGQAAVELDMCQNHREKGFYSWQTEKTGDQWILLTADIIRGVVEDIIAGVSRGIISRRFHNTLIRMFTELCVKIRDESGINEVALSGGSFQNITLLEGLTHSLNAREFSVYSHSLVPSNDGCLALGQAVCAGLRYAGIKGKYGEG